MTAPVDPPKASPTVPSLGDDPSPSGSHNVATIREAVVIADAAVEKTAKATRWQWLGLSFLGALVVGLGGFLAWCLILVGTLSGSTAAAQATTSTTVARVDKLETRIETIDAGGSQATERLERKIDANEEHAQRERDAMNAKLDRLLVEVKKK